MKVGHFNANGTSVTRSDGGESVIRMNGGLLPRRGAQVMSLEVLALKLGVCREFENLRTIKHPNVVRYLGHGEFNNMIAIGMDLVCP